MAFEFIQKKFDNYISMKSNELFELACVEMMGKPMKNPILCSVHVGMDSKKHIVTAVIKQTKGMFLDSGMRAEIMASAPNSAGILEFSFVVFDTKEPKETIDTDVVCTYYWCRTPGRYVNKNTGNAIYAGDHEKIDFSFVGSVKDWYETLVETIAEASNEVHRVSLDGPAETIKCSPDVVLILETSMLYQPAKDDSIYAGTLANRFNIIKDASIDKNIIEVSRIREKKWTAIVKILEMNVI